MEGLGSEPGVSQAYLLLHGCHHPTEEGIGSQVAGKEGLGVGFKLAPCVLLSKH